MISSKRLGPAVSHRHARSWRLALPQTSRGSQDDPRAGYGVMDVVDSEHDAMQAQRVGRRVLRPGAVRRGGVIPGQFQLAVAVRGPHHRDLAPDAVDLMWNGLSRVLAGAVWGAGGRYGWLSRKVAMESSSSCHHGVRRAGAMVPVQGEENDRSRYPVMLAILSCSQALKCARVRSRS